LDIKHILTQRKNKITTFSFDLSFQKLISLIFASDAITPLIVKHCLMQIADISEELTVLSPERDN